MKTDQKGAKSTGRGWNENIVGIKAFPSNTANSRALDSLALFRKDSFPANIFRKKTLL